LNFYKHHLGDYAKKTAALSVTQHGAYLLMLHHFYATEEPLPVGRDLYRLLRADSKPERDAIDFIVAKFWRQEEGGLVNDRALEEIQHAAHQRTVNREVGKLGGRPKRTEQITESVSEPEPNSNPSQTPDSRLQKRAEARATRFALTSVPDEWVNFCKQERPDLDPARTFAKFGDYWRGKGGQAGRKLDWLATWRNWVREERGPTGRLPDAPKVSAGHVPFVPEVVNVAPKDDPNFQKLIAKMKVA
jgi:uncharacterized protein YdaU (DUF1376 family)